MAAPTDPSDELELTRTGSRTSTVFDAITEDLQELRFRAGDVSYAEIAARIARRREENGTSAAAARVARSTVFDAFRSGRRRINPTLIAEIAIALGESEEAAEHWRKRCFEARRHGGSPRPAIGDPPPLPAAPVSPASSASPAPVSPAPAAAPSTPARPVPVAPATPAAIPHRMPTADGSEQLRTMRTALTIALLAACIGANVFGNTIIMKFDLPIFLDMVGTAVAAFALGPWYGVLVAVGTNLATTLSGDAVSLAFLPVNVVGALLWGYGYHRIRAARTPWGFVLLTLAVALGCSLVAAPTTLLLDGGVVSHSSVAAATALISSGQSPLLAIFSANIAASLLDKLISGYAALLIARLLRPLQLGSAPRTRA